MRTKKLAFILLIFVIGIFYLNIKNEPVEEKPILPSAVVVATMYNPTEEQCDADPFITAGNYRINPNKASKHNWIAMSRDLLKRWGGEFDYGDKVQIIGAGHKDGIYKVVDTMNPRFRNRIDFLETDGTPWYKFKNVTVQKIMS